MYLKSIVLENVGPIPRIELTLPFAGERPLPTVLVGTNGSGKTTLLSFIVNALIAFKQQVFEDVEVESNRVFRVRSGLFLRGGAHYYHAKLQFQDALSLEEWVLDRQRKAFETEVTLKPSDEGWKKIAENESDRFEVSPPLQPPPFGKRPEPKLAKLFSENVVLYFPSDRFEPPDWLNSKSLSADLQFPEPVTMEGLTARRILARSLLKPTLEWLQSVALDQFLTEQKSIQIPLPATSSAASSILNAIVNVPGVNSEIINSARVILGRVLGGDWTNVQLGLNNRNSRRFFATSNAVEKPVQTIPNLLGLSAGQSALFCLFCNIIRDFDLAGAQSSKPGEIRGIVLIDEADLHLHLDLQFQVLPELVKMFPKVQFIVTAHSPMFVMGMRNTFTEDGFMLVDMPSGQQISTEAYSEFVQAFEAFRTTRAFEEKLRVEVQAGSKPLLFVEGKNDRTHLETAWSKLYPDQEQPFVIRSIGDYGTGKKSDAGGVQTLKLMLELLGRYEVRPVVGLFDNDRAGAAQFGGLSPSHGFSKGDDLLHLRHANGFVHACLLPVPPDRTDFAPDCIPHRVLELEHYYSDEILHENGVADTPAYPGTKVFEIKDSRKTAFAEAAKTLNVAAFVNFSPLFRRMLEVFGISAVKSVDVAAAA